MRVDRIVLGITVAIVGLVWLLVNLGLISNDAARELWRYWPLLLVLWGLLLLFGRGGDSVGCLMTILIIVFLFSGFFAFTMPYHRNQPVKTHETVISAEENTSSVKLDITQNAGELLLSSKAVGLDLFRGKFETDSGAPAINSVKVGDATEITVRDTSGYTIGKRMERWEIGLAEQVPAEIHVRSGAGKVNLDLRKLLVSELSLTAGAGDLTIRLGSVDTRITIETGAGSITIEVPETIGVRVKTDGGLLSVKGENAKIVSIGDRRYESRDIEQKQAVADIQITAGAGSVTFRPVSK